MRTNDIDLNIIFHHITVPHIKLSNDLVILATFRVHNLSLRTSDSIHFWWTENRVTFICLFSCVPWKKKVKKFWNDIRESKLWLVKKLGVKTWWGKLFDSRIQCCVSTSPLSLCEAGANGVIGRLIMIFVGCYWWLVVLGPNNLGIASFSLFFLLSHSLALCPVVLLSFSNSRGRRNSHTRHQVQKQSACPD